MWIIENNIVFLLQAVQKFGGIDILVSNAAVNPTVGGVLDVSILVSIFPYSTLPNNTVVIYYHGDFII